MISPHAFFVLFTQSLGVTIATNYVTVHFIIVPWFQWNALGVLHIVLYETLFFMVIWSHWQTMCSSPGVTNQNVVSWHCLHDMDQNFMEAAILPLFARCLKKPMTNSRFAT